METKFLQRKYMWLHKDEPSKLISVHVHCPQSFTKLFVIHYEISHHLHGYKYTKFYNCAQFGRIIKTPSIIWQEESYPTLQDYWPAPDSDHWACWEARFWRRDLTLGMAGVSGLISCSFPRTHWRLGESDTAIIMIIHTFPLLSISLSPTKNITGAYDKRAKRYC